MNARRQWMGLSLGVVGLALLANCNSTGEPLASNSRNGSGEGGALSGQVALLQSQPDSGTVPLPGVAVVLQRFQNVDSIPDSTGACCDPIPPGMTPLMDSIPGDTMPPPPPPVDSIPPDSNPPPPPPPPGDCFGGAEPVASTTTDEAGRFAFRGLRPGLYNIIARPTIPNVFVANFCGLGLHKGQRLSHLIIVVIPKQPAESLMAGTR